MAKQHELLAVERDTKTRFHKIIQEAKMTFTKRTSHFDEYHKSYNPTDEAYSNDRPDEEHTVMVDTVPNKLNYVMPYFENLADVVIQKEETNQHACADIVIHPKGGEKTTLATNVPVQALLQYEDIISEVRDTIASTPTLDPARKWSPSTTREHVFDAESFVRVRTRKIQKPIVLYQATDKHPAQTQLITEDSVIGEYNHSDHSGRLSPLQKSRMLERCDMLLIAVKKARAQANDIDHSKTEVGSKFTSFIMEVLKG